MTRGGLLRLRRCHTLRPESYALAFDILEHAKVAVAPGIDFGPNGEGYLRLSYANSLENIHEGLRRLKQYLGHGITYP